MGDATTFSNLQTASKDSLSLQLNALKVYQKLIDFHIKKDHKNALAAIDIERLNFINLHAIFNKKENSLVATLKASKEQNKYHEASGLYAFEIAKIYKEQSKNNQAIIICDQIIKRFPKSFGAKKCRILKSQIEQKTLSIKTEEYIPIDKNSRVLVTYKNVEKLFFTAYNINEKQQKELGWCLF